VVKVLGVLLTVVPFAFAGIRFATTGTDLRYLWMAIASTLCAAGFLLRSTPRTAPSPARTGLALLASATSAAAIAIMLGATAGLGIAIVALAFGLSSTVGIGLVLHSRHPQSG
jgi:bacteriorhodopsin